MDKIFYPRNYYFTTEHEWVHVVSDELVEVGITELVIRELKLIDRIEIFTLGETLQKKQVFGRIICGTEKTKLIMPVSGTVSEINEDYCSNSSLINEKYCHDHWIIRIRPSQPLDVSDLLTLEKYKEYKINNMLHMIRYLISLDNT